VGKLGAIAASMGGMSSNLAVLKNSTPIAVKRQRGDVASLMEEDTMKVFVAAVRDNNVGTLRSKC